MRDFPIRVGVALIGLGACCAISCDGSKAKPDRGDAAAPGPGDGGAQADAAPPRVVGAIARATLASVSARADIPPVTGTAEFRVTGSGVDLNLHMFGCQGSAPYPVTIVQATDCASAAQAPIWSNGGGEHVPGVYCAGTSGTGTEDYSRSSALPTHWSVGDGAASDVIGHAVIVHDPVNAEALSCGVIVAQPDAPFVPSPPLDQAPSLPVRALLAGSCVAQSVIGTAGQTCPDQHDFVDCVAEHCDLGRCVAACAGYTPCLDAAENKCDSAYTCPLDATCSDCTSTLWSCAAGYCASEMFCTVQATPHGPCDQLRACCALQGAGAGDCLDTFEPIISFGGDATCLNGQTDWDVIAHLTVPCKFESDPPAVSGGGGRSDGTGASGSPLEGVACESDADCGDLVCLGASRGASFTVMGKCHAKPPTPQLGDGVAGRACRDDSECGSGRCETRAPIGIAFPGSLCTGDCYDDATCGAGGVCLWLHQTEPGLCLESCASDADCGRAGYRCMPLGDGRRKLHACYPGAPPLPAGVAGRACASDADCNARAGSCRTELSLLAFGTTTNDTVVPAPAGYCSESCYFDADCGDAADCVSGGPGGGLCFASCTPSAPCRDGYVCSPNPRGDPAATLCIPAPPATPTP